MDVKDSMAFSGTPLCYSVAKVSIIQHMDRTRDTDSSTQQILECSGNFPPVTMATNQNPLLCF